MQPVISHSWSLTPDEAIELQLDLARRVITTGDVQDPGIIAGVDVSYENETARAAIALFRAGEADAFKIITAEVECVFPYISGLFAFRELPAILEALKQCPDGVGLFICDGQGIAHPRRFGMASHLGLLFDTPSIGCAKTWFLGDFEEPVNTRGAQTPLVDQGQIVGAALRTQANVKPVFISPGHRISRENACRWVLDMAPRYRLPEPIRMADQASRGHLSL